jgi:hypothetical protein
MREPGIQSDTAKLKLKLLDSGSQLRCVRNDKHSLRLDQSRRLVGGRAWGSRHSRKIKRLEVVEKEREYGHEI